MFCGNSTAVTNSRHQKQLNQVWRRRFCSNCSSTFTTHEKIDWSSAVAVRDSKGGLTPFSRDILFVSIYESCKHRPDALTAAAGLTQTIIAGLQTVITDGTLEKQRITRTAHAVLGRFDQTTAAVYLAFHQIKTTS